MKSQTTILAGRFQKLPAAPIETGLTLRSGTVRDYRALAEHHYRAHDPATITRVLVLDSPTHACGFTRSRTHPHPAAVLLESHPALACRLRDHATGNRYAGLRDTAARPTPTTPALPRPSPAPASPSPASRCSTSR